LRVNLTDGKLWMVDLDEYTVEKWVGGVRLRAKYLYDEVPSGIKWSAPEIRIIWTTGPLAGSVVEGTATGWDWTLEDAFTAGLRVTHLLRVFNLRHGLKIENERPSKRYGSSIMKT
jgi:aldehyde:ferredoxin oxidoreductase